MNAVKIIQANLSHSKILSKLGYDTFYETFVHLNNPEDFEAYISKAFTVEQIEKEIATHFQHAYVGILKLKARFGVFVAYKHYFSLF